MAILRASLADEDSDFSKLEVLVRQKYCNLVRVLRPPLVAQRLQLAIVHVVENAEISVSPLSDEG